MYLSNIRAQLNIPETTLSRVLTFAKKWQKNPEMNKDDSRYLRNLVKSMPRRFKDVIRQDGGVTKY